MALKTEVNGKEKSIPSHLGLLTIAMVTRPETDRMAAARRWLGADNVFTEREEHLLRGFWKVLDGEPEGATVTRVGPEFKVKKGGV